ncbi:MAG TPA: DegT/DnrJ/EryC1/StrS family aminotransferase [Gemmatimonadaceae bacterium]|nr:DegT/DnrJ/EryC1/StrS family aminotransferase [Gemmatimonadaceae bacterium]
MTWRRVPPVYSPVGARALMDGVRAAIGAAPDLRTMVESSLRHRYGSADVILTDGGTSALLLALQNALPKGATVALPSYCCIDVTAAAVAAGVGVRLYDVDPVTLSPNPDSVRAAISRGVQAIVVAHLYGYPADVRAVQSLAAEHGILVIEDAAQAAGGSVNGSLLGSIGDIAVLSFGRGKGTTAGSGGALLIKSSRLSDFANRARSVTRNGTRGAMQLAGVAAQAVLAHPWLYALPASVPALRLGEMVYHPAHSPRRISRVGAAVLNRTLASAEADVAARRARAASLLSEIESIASVVTVRTISGGNSGYLRLAVLDSAGVREARPDLGVLRGYPLTLDQHSQLEPLLHPGERAGSGSVYLRERLFTIPTHPRTTQSHSRDVVDWLRTARIAPHVAPAFS